MRATRGAQGRAFDQQPVDAVEALIVEHGLEAKAGAPVGPQVAGVEEPLPVCLAEQGARIWRRVVTAIAVTEPPNAASRSPQAAQVRRQCGVGEEHAADLEDGDGPGAPIHGDCRVRVMGEAEVVEVGVAEDDRRTPGAVGHREHAGDVAQTPSARRSAVGRCGVPHGKSPPSGAVSGMPRSRRTRVPSLAATSMHMPPISCWPRWIV